MDYKSILENNIFKAIFTLSLVVIFYFTRTIINRLINSKADSIRKRYIYRQFNNYFFLSLSLGLIIFLWLEWFQSILTILSIAVAAIIVVSKEFILNLIANGVIITRELFDAGDRIQIGNHAGDVIETGPVFITLSEIGNWSKGDEPSGRVIKIPNSMVLTNPVANYSRGLSLLWNELSIELAVDSNWQKAKEIGQSVADSFSHKLSDQEIKTLINNSEEVMFVQTKPSTSINLRDSKLILNIRFICKYHKRNLIEQQVLQEVLTQFTKEDDIYLLGSHKSRVDDGKQ